MIPLERVRALVGVQAWKDAIDAHLKEDAERDTDILALREAKYQTWLLLGRTVDERDLLEAERQELKAALEQAVNVDRIKTYQLDRLREIAEHMESEQFELRRERDRLREEFDQMQQERDSFGHQLARANGENARLREEIARYKADPTLLLNVDESKVVYFPEETT